MRNCTRWCESERERERERDREELYKVVCLVCICMMLVCFVCICMMLVSFVCRCLMLSVRLGYIDAECSVRVYILLTY